MRWVGRGVGVLAVVVLAVLAVLVAGCGGGGSDPNSEGGGGSSSKPKVYEVGDSISVKHGDTFVIALEANPTTGYSWEAEDNADVEFVKSKQVQGSSNAIGAPGTRQLTFQAVKTGSTTLTLNYLRPFETGVPPVQTEDFPVAVT